jgi:uncharacterized protein (DUF362 family)
MNRRDFLKTTFLGALAVGTLGKALEASGAAISDSAFPDMVALHGSTPENMWKTGIESLGGMSRFVKKGAKVVVKPNIAWTQVPEYAANTNPELVAAIVKDAIKAGASEVIVFDHSCDNGPDCYKISGIAAAASGAGAKVLSATNRSSYSKVAIPNGKVMKEAEIFSAVLDCDTFINVPILKHHGGTRLSGAMKNLMGIIWDRRIMHKLGLNDTIVDLLTVRKPDLNVIDAYRYLADHGPRGGNLNDVVLGKFMLISPDAVSADAAALRLMRFKENEIGYLMEASARNLGEKNLKSLNIKRCEM